MTKLALILVLLGAVILAVWYFNSTQAAAEVRTYCNGHTQYCTTDPQDPKLKDPLNAPPLFEAPKG